MKHYPAFQFRDGKIIDALAEINKAFVTACGDAQPTLVAAALLDWWQTPQPRLPKNAAGSDQSPLELLGSVSEQEFDSAIRETNAMNNFVMP